MSFRQQFKTPFLFGFRRIVGVVNFFVLLIFARIVGVEELCHWWRYGDMNL